MTDPAEIRAEGRRLLAEYRRVTESPREYYERLAAGSKWVKWVQLHADVLLADPAPVGLTEDERVTVDWLRDSGDPWDRRVLAIIDRLSAAPRAEREALERIARQGRRKPSDTGLNAVDLAMIARDALAALPAPVPEGVPEDHRVCSHGIYHHGCPSCDRQDPEEL